jgi:hypothetical protein
LALAVNEMLDALIEPPESVKALTVWVRSARATTSEPEPNADPAKPIACAWTVECDVLVKLTAQHVAVIVVERPR